VYRVGDLVVDVRQQRIWRRSEELEVPELSFRLFRVLIERAPNFVSFDHLIDTVWSGLTVNEGTVTQRVKLLRDTIGDDPQAPQYIGTVRGRGYRLLCRAEPIADRPDSASVDAHPVGPRALPASRRGLVVLGGLTLVLMGTLLVRVYSSRTADSMIGIGTASMPKTVAVLPFRNLSSEPDGEYLSDGVSDELIRRLSLVPQLQVTARTSSFSFKDKSVDAQTIARRLGVRSLVMGSVGRNGNRVRVTAQLVDIENGNKLWSEVFDRDLSELLTIQDEIASAVGASLGISPRVVPVAVRGDRFSRDPVAVESYLRGRYLYQSWAIDRIDKGIDYLENAIRIDPGFAAAYVAQAEALFARAQVTTECCDPNGPWTKPRHELLRRALELDPTNADAIASMGFDLMMARDFEGAERTLHRAEAINPNGELVLRYLAYYYQSVGWPPEKSIIYGQQLLRHDPLNVLAAFVLGSSYWQVQQYEQALAVGDKAVELDPTSWLAHWLRSGALIDLGRYEEAILAATKAVELSGGTGNAYADLVTSYAGAGKLVEARRIFAKADAPGYKPRWRSAFRAYALLAIGEYEQAVAAIEQAYRENDGFLHEVVHYKVFMPMHDDPRFQEVVRRLGQERRVQHTRDIVRALELTAKARQAGRAPS
jgi:TolB-like protein/DNA-binding winged helix-turn-helix (wHTH) protein/Flp pilus assembly protein TadD